MEGSGYRMEHVDETYGNLVMVPSESMGRELPALVFLPRDYGRTERPFPVVFKLHGSCANAEKVNEEGLRAMHNPGTRMLELADMFQVIIVAPIVGNTFYLDSLVNPDVRISTYIGRELPAFVDAAYRTPGCREGRILAGFSMGGYGAVATLCRYPDTFSAALSRSGCFDLAFGPKELGWDNPVAEDMLGSYAEDPRPFEQNSCFNLIERVKDRDDVGIVLECGVHEFLYKDNQAFHQKLTDLGVRHIYAEYPCDHVWNHRCLLSLLSHLQDFRETLFEDRGGARQPAPVSA